MKIEDDKEALDLLPLFVLGALDPAEMLAVSAYIEAHQELQPRLHEIEELASQLAYAAPEAALPTQRRSLLLERVQADLAGSSTPRATAPIALPTTTRRQHASWPARSRRWGALAAAALLAITLATYAGWLQGRVDALQAEIARLQTTTAGLQQMTEQLRQQMQNEQQQLALLAGADRTLALVGKAAPAARGTFYLSDEQGVLVVQGLPPLADQETYQLWLVADGKPISAGLLAVQEGAPTVVTVAVPPNAQGFAAFDISVEPAGGSSTLLGPVVLQWKAGQSST